MQIFDKSLFFKCSLLALLVAPACADKDGDDEPTDGDSTAAGTSSASGGNTTSNTSSNTTSNTTSNTSTSGTSGDTGGGQACAGDWTLGSVPFTGDPTLGQACDGNPPKNCADGTYIMFGTGECVCIAMCSSLGKEVGQNCTDNGQWVCQDIEATNASMNSAKACVNKDWNLCTKGGSGGTTSGGGTTSTSGGTTSGGGTTSTSGGSGSCAPSGAPCTFSDDCCSQDCSFDQCA